MLVVAQGGTDGRTARCQDISQYSGSQPVPTIVLCGTVASPACVLIAIEDDMLPPFAEVHQIDARVPQHTVIVSQSYVECPCPCPFGLILQFQVDGRRFGRHLVFQGFHMFVVLQNLYGGHIVSFYSLGGNAVTSLQHVHVFNVEMVDWYSLILDDSPLNAYTRKLLQYIADGTVVLFGICCHQIVQRITVSPQLLSLYLHFAQSNALLLYFEVQCLVFYTNPSHITLYIETCHTN